MTTYLPRVLACAVTALLLLPYSLSAQVTPNITARGEGEASMRPDFVELSFVVNAADADADAAKRDVDARTAAVLEVLKAHSIAERDMVFSGVLVNPRYEADRNGNETVTGYEVSRSIELKLRKIDEYELLVGGIVDAGVDSIESAEGGLDDPSTLMLAALTAAARDARLRAEAIAEGLGVTLGAVMDVGEDRLYPIPDYQMNIADNATYEEIVVTGARIRRPPPLNFVPGDITAEGTVVARFAIEEEP